MHIFCVQSFFFIFFYCNVRASHVCLFDGYMIWLDGSAFTRNSYMYGVAHIIIISRVLQFLITEIYNIPSVCAHNNVFLEEELLRYAFGFPVARVENNFFLVVFLDAITK